MGTIPSTALAKIDDTKFEVVTNRTLGTADNKTDAHTKKEEEIVFKEVPPELQ